MIVVPLGMLAWLRRSLRVVVRVLSVFAVDSAEAALDELPSRPSGYVDLKLLRRWTTRMVDLFGLERGPPKQMALALWTRWSGSGPTSVADPIERAIIGAHTMMEIKASSV